MSRVIIEVVGLQKTFTRLFHAPVEAVHSVSFSVKKGQIVGLLGPNGAGKTTTLQMMLGVLTPSAGEVYFFGQPLQKRRTAVLEKVNFASAYVNLPWLLTVHEVLTYFSYLYSLVNPKQNVETVITDFRLQKLRNRAVRTLSAGQLARLNLAKAFLNQPEILFLDEPTASLDPETAIFVRKYLADAQRKWQTTIVLASHNMNEVRQLCDQVVFIKAGQVVASGNPLTLAKKYSQSKLQFQVKSHKDEVMMLAQKLQLTVQQTGRNGVELSLSEHQVVPFIQQLLSTGAVIDRLRIIEPSLEDLFVTI